MANRVGRPRKNPIDRQEIVNVFARQPADVREQLLSILPAVDAGLRAAKEPQDSAPEGPSEGDPVGLASTTEIPPKHHRATLPGNGGDVDKD